MSCEKLIASHFIGRSGAFPVRLQIKYKEDGVKSLSQSFYSQLPQTAETQFARAASELQSEVSQADPRATGRPAADSVRECEKINKSKQRKRRFRAVFRCSPAEVQEGREAAGRRLSVLGDGRYSGHAARQGGVTDPESGSEHTRSPDSTGWGVGLIYNDVFIGIII